MTQSGNRSLLWISIAVSALFLLPGCKKSYHATVAERSDRIDAFSAELKELKASLPGLPEDSPVFQKPEASGPDLPYFHIKDDHSNTVILTTETMDDIRAVGPEDEGGYFEMPGLALNTLQKMAHPPKGKDSGWFAKRVDRLLEARYLIVLDVKEEQPIEIMEDSKSFRGGAIISGVHFYDRSGRAWLGSFPVVAVPKIGYAFGESNELRGKMMTDIKANARDEFQKQLKETLSEGTGGFFEFEYNAPGRDGQPIPWTLE